MRIAKAVKEAKPGKVKALQWLVTHSFYAKLLAVKRVTSNKGRKTPGVDGVVWKGARAKMKAARSLKRRGYKPLPLRRIYIPKKIKGTPRLYQVVRTKSIGIKRHVKIRAHANPYLKKYAGYFWRRRNIKGATWALTWG